MALLIRSPAAHPTYPVEHRGRSRSWRVIWFEEPARALSDAVRFMAYATHEDMRVLRRYVSDDDFREALDKASPGIIDLVRGHIGTRSSGVTRRHQCRDGGSSDRSEVVTIYRTGAPEVVDADLRGCKKIPELAILKR